MFNVKIADFRDHDLVFLLDEDNGFWFIIRHTQSQNHVDSYSFGEFTFAIENRHGGNIYDFFDNKVIPESTQKIKQFFGEDSGTPVDPSDLRAMLEQIVRNEITFDEQAIELKRQP